MRGEAARAALLGAGIHAVEAGDAARQPRYYQHHEVLLIRRIRDLLYEQGFTINGARNRLETETLKKHNGEAAHAAPPQQDSEPEIDVREELQAILELLQKP